METYRMKGIYGEGDVYVLKTIEDWDEYEKLCKERNSDFLKYNPNFFSFKKDFEKYIGKTWQDKEQLRYTYNGVPVYVEYKVIAIEDNNPMMDWFPLIIFYLQMTYTHPSVRVVPKNGNNQAYLQTQQ